nr:RNA repair domain-containing protein [Candidatus Njordarchaeota archaeon]
MVGAREVLNKLIWDKRFNLADYAIIFVHRGAPHDLKVVWASHIKVIEKSFFFIDEDTMIPFHRVRAIRNLRTGEDIYTREGGVHYPLEEIEGHEELGDFEDKAHHPRTEEVISDGTRTIQYGARLSFPEKDMESFSERVKEGLKFGMVELSFFEYSAASQESEKYRSIVTFAENAVLESGLNIASLHLPNANMLNESAVEELLNTFLPFCSHVGCNNIVVHPAKVKDASSHELDRARAKLGTILKKFTNELERYSVTLSIETFPGTHRILSGATDIGDFLEYMPSIFQIAYDTSHTTGDTDEVIKDIMRNIDKIRVFHFSNRCEEEHHIPIFDLKGELNFNKIIRTIRSSEFSGMIVLEYEPTRYRMLVERDLKTLRNVLNYN